MAVVVVAGVLTTSAGWLVWQASDVSLPPLAKGMPASFEEGDRAFRERIEALYPVGSSEARLVSDLHDQGFEVTTSPSPQSSFGRLNRFIGCGDKVWSIHWRANDGRLTEVRALYGAVCL